MHSALLNLKLANFDTTNLDGRDLADAGAGGLLGHLLGKELGYLGQGKKLRELDQAWEPIMRRAAAPMGEAQRAINSLSDAMNIPHNVQGPRLSPFQMDDLLKPHIKNRTALSKLLRPALDELENIRTTGRQNILRSSNLKSLLGGIIGAGAGAAVGPAVDRHFVRDDKNLQDLFKKAHMSQVFNLRKFVTQDYGRPKSAAFATMGALKGLLNPGDSIIDSTFRGAGADTGIGLGALGGSVAGGTAGAGLGGLTALLARMAGGPGSVSKKALIGLLGLGGAGGAGIGALGGAIAGGIRGHGLVRDAINKSANAQPNRMGPGETMGYMTGALGGGLMGGPLGMGLADHLTQKPIGASGIALQPREWYRNFVNRGLQSYEGLVGNGMKNVTPGAGGGLLQRIARINPKLALNLARFNVASRWHLPDLIGGAGAFGGSILSALGGGAIGGAIGRQFDPTRTKSASIVPTTARWLARNGGRVWRSMRGVKPIEAITRPIASTVTSPAGGGFLRRWLPALGMGGTGYFLGNNSGYNRGMGEGQELGFMGGMDYANQQFGEAPFWTRLFNPSSAIEPQMQQHYTHLLNKGLLKQSAAAPSERDKARGIGSLVGQGIGGLGGAYFGTPIAEKGFNFFGRKFMDSVKLNKQLQEMLAGGVGGAARRGMTGIQNMGNLLTGGGVAKPHWLLRLGLKSPGLAKFVGNALPNLARAGAIGSILAPSIGGMTLGGFAGAGAGGALHDAFAQPKTAAIKPPGSGLMQFLASIGKLRSAAQPPPPSGLRELVSLARRSAPSTRNIPSMALAKPPVAAASPFDGSKDLQALVAKAMNKEAMKKTAFLQYLGKALPYAGRWLGAIPGRIGRGLQLGAGKAWQALGGGHKATMLADRGRVGLGNIGLNLANHRAGVSSAFNALKPWQQGSLRVGQFAAGMVPSTLMYGGAYAGGMQQGAQRAAGFAADQLEGLSNAGFGDRARLALGLAFKPDMLRQLAGQIRTAV